MTDTIVSVRMPSTLVTELKQLAEKNHYMDLSEEIRSLVRSKCLEYSDSKTHGMKQIRKELETAINGSNNEQLIREVKKLIEEVKNGS